MRRVSMILIPCVAAALLAGCSKDPVAPEPVRAVRTATVSVASASGVVEYAAEVRARTESRLGFRVPGKMLRRPAELGQRVRAGQLLAELDPQDLRLGEQAAAASVRAAQVQFDQAAADFRRFKELREQGFISTAELERRESTLKSAQAQLEQARAQASTQVNQAGYAQLRATVDGVVTAVEAEPGAVLPVGATVLRVAHAGPRDVVFSVPEQQHGALRSLVGVPKALQVRLWGRDELLPASVREVSASADPATRTFLVKADVGAAAVQLGQTATVLMRLPDVEGVVRLPLSSLLEQQGRTVVWVVEPDSMAVRAQPVVVAGADGNLALIAQGLSPGQRVVTAGVHVLTPGQKVRFYAEPAGGAPALPAATPVGAVAPSGR